MQGAVPRGAVHQAKSDALHSLERDIHDGPQQRLVRRNMDLARAKRHAAADPQKAEALITEVMNQTQETLADGWLFITVSDDGVRRCQRGGGLRSEHGADPAVDAGQKESPAAPRVPKRRIRSAGYLFVPTTREQLRPPAPPTPP